MALKNKHHQKRADGHSSLKSQNRDGQNTATIAEGAVVTGLLIIGYMLALSPSHRVAAVWVFFSAWALVGLIVAVRLTHEFSQPPEIRQENERIRSIDALREEGRKLQLIFGATTGNLPNDEPNRWLEKVQLSLRSISRSYAKDFDKILKDPRRQTGGGLSPELNQADMMHWMNDDPRRQQEWPRIAAVLHYLDQVRDKLYKNLK